VSVEVSSAASGPSSFPGLSKAAWQDVAAEGALGTANPHAVDLSADQLRSLYRLMALSRRVDRQAINLNPPGSPRRLRFEFTVRRRRRWARSSRSRPMTGSSRPTARPLARSPAGSMSSSSSRSSREAGIAASTRTKYRVAPLTTPLATQALHAVGLAMAAKIKHDPIVALTFFGDGAASEGDAHEALNMAGVYGAPVVFVVQNNGYAIKRFRIASRPERRRSRCARRASGFPGSASTATT